MHTKYRLSIVTPCFNPPLNWLQNYLDNYKIIENILDNFEFNFVLVNDGSISGITEQDIQVLKNKIKNFTYIILSENMGKGYAIREGFRSAQFENLIFTDIDFPYKTESLVKMAEMLVENKIDIIVGTRNKEYYSGVPLYRTLISKVLINLNKLLLKLPTGETQAGLKAFSSKGKQAVLNSKINEYLFDIEVLKIGKLSGAKIAQCPVEIRKGIEFRRMSLKVLVREIKNYIRILCM